MEEYRLEIKVKNNLLYSLIEQQRYSSLAKFCDATDICYPALIGLINLKKSPLNKKGKFKKFINKLCDVLNCIPEQLFSQNQIDLELETNKFTKKVHEAEMKFLMQHEPEQKLLEDIMHESRRQDAILGALDSLTPREKKVLEMRWGLGCEPMTLEEMGHTFDVTRERIRQIEAKALRKLRHPARADILKEYY